MKFAEDLLQLFLLSVLCWEIVKNVYIYGISAIYRHCVPGTWWCWVAGYLSGTDLLWVIGYVLICHIHRPTSHMVVAMTPINNEMFLVGGVVVWSGQSTHQPVPTHTPIHTHLPIQIWAEAKKRYTLSVRGQKQVHTLNQVKNAPHESCHWSKTHCTCFCPIKPQAHLSLSTLLDFQLFFFVF